MANFIQLPLRKQDEVGHDFVLFLNKSVFSSIQHFSNLTFNFMRKFQNVCRSASIPSVPSKLVVSCDNRKCFRIWRFLNVSTFHWRSFNLLRGKFRSKALIRLKNFYFHCTTLFCSHKNYSLVSFYGICFSFDAQPVHYSAIDTLLFRIFYHNFK
jgi:hypothetical protein